jgi:energy-coupling factor transport system permease protein
LKQEGLQFAIFSAGRILGISSSFLLFSLVTRPDNLMIALEQRGVPNSLTYIVLSTLQIVPSFRAKAQTIVDAQHARGLQTKGGLKTRIRALLPLVEPLVLGSIMDIDERAIALEARAFSRRGQRTFLRDIRDTRWQRFLRLLLLALSLLIIIGRVVWVFWR